MSTRYNRPETEDDMLDDTTPVNENLSAKESTFEKRYSDLRSYSQRQINSLSSKIEGLEQQLRASTTQELRFPKNESEVEAWMNKYPDVAAIVQTIAMKEVSKAREDVDKRFDRLTKKEKEAAKRDAQAELSRLHPDFFTDIVESEEFSEWIQRQSKASQDALFVNETDVQAASEVISRYKYEMEPKTRKKNTRNPREEATDVGVRTGSSLGDGSRGRTFRESEIAVMTASQYERFEEEIDNARANGRIIYDLSAAA